MANSPFQNPLYRGLLLVVGFLFLVAAPIGLSVELARLSDARASRSWPSVLGTITSAKIEEVRGNRSRSTWYFPRVEFDYEVAGKPYHGDRFSAHGSSCDKHADAKRLIDRYQVGSKHRVFYDPAKPESSLVEPGTSRHPAAPFVMIAMSMIIGSAVMVIWYRTLPARK